MARIVRVKHVLDGDTFETSDGEFVRLKDINAPEKGQPGAAKATRDLEAKLAGQVVSSEEVAKDIHGRTVARVIVGGRYIK